MKKSLLIVAVVLAWTASVASAGGMNLAWNDCYGQGGTTHRAFACDTDEGSNDLYVSFEPDVAIPDVNAAYAIIDLQSRTCDLPSWWQVRNPGSCRVAALSAVASITGTCMDPWNGQGIPSIAAYFTFANAPQIIPGSNRARIVASVQLPEQFAAPVQPGTEYFCVLVRITNTKTVGDGACPGCQVGVFLVLYEMLLTSVNSGDHRLFTGDNTFATWQDSWLFPPLPPCQTPALNRTWGQLKSGYR